MSPGKGQARTAAETLLARVHAAQKAGTWMGSWKNENWYEIQASYGSEAYIRGGWEREAVNQERKEAGLEARWN